jgi:acetaldehyde dehydrogenase
MRNSKHLAMGAMVGIDPQSDGLARAGGWALPVTPKAWTAWSGCRTSSDIRIVFDATSAGAHAGHNKVLQAPRRQGDRPDAGRHRPLRGARRESGGAHLASPNINMVTCGGQATIPVVRAVSKVARVRYAEIVASIASKSAGPGTRANIDEFTETTSAAIVMSAAPSTARPSSCSTLPNRR